MADKYNQRWVMALAPKGEPRWAITIGQTAYYSCPESEVDPAWRAHEDEHKRQWRDEGRVVFSLKYLWWQLRYGYRDNPYEVAARAAEKIDTCEPIV